MQSAASGTLQGKAIQRINNRWGHGRWKGTETLGITVCKKKYSPFVLKCVVGEDGNECMALERMYGCHCHSDRRKVVTKRYGERKGWESFEQWSAAKAKLIAKEVQKKFAIELGDSIPLCSCDLKRKKSNDLPRDFSSAGR
uniref:Uncharacterized protein n=1 Tax=Corethron hystrix TaxID=216773 RepID=A0A7S1FSU4_9STRA|mmetsp:Transcript_25983/g.59789  ORF Transcript_25983/g.59789 Transcript_25983/m.59789 type:complete len:141 (+) Transcript_25983:417-839(+)